MHGLDHLIHFNESQEQDNHKTQIIRIAKSHSKINLNIHPHDYYYWCEAFIMTLKKVDNKWHSDLEYYLRECLFFPISFIISFYHKNS